MSDFVYVMLRNPDRVRLVYVFPDGSERYIESGASKDHPCTVAQVTKEEAEQLLSCGIAIRYSSATEYASVSEAAKQSRERAEHQQH